MDLLSALRTSAEQAGWSAGELARALAERGQPLARIDFVAQTTSCPSCGGALGVYKTRTRSVSTLTHGRFEARETLMRCDRSRPERNRSCPTIEPDELSRLVPPRQEFGYDLIVFVGLARYLEAKQREEIQAALSARGVHVSTGTVTTLCDRFLCHLERLHLVQAPHLRAAMSRGWSLHIDATCDKGKGGHFVCMDGLSGWVLQASRIASESEDELAPTVKRTVELFGDPVAVVRDLGKGGANAVQVLRERGIKDLVCHQHFLRAAGTRLFKQPYDRLRGLLKLTGLRSKLLALRKDLRLYREEVGSEGPLGPGRVRDELLALVHWLLEGDCKATLSFPFALPHLELLLRCSGAAEMADAWVPRPRNAPERRAMQRLDSLLRKPGRDRRTAPTVAELQDCWRVFCDLRAVLRLADSERPQGRRGSRQLPIPSVELVRLREIEMAVRHYEQDLRYRAGDEATKKRSSKPEAIVLRYLDRYREHLFGHPAIRDEQGRIVAVVERTNNSLEHLFGAEKQGLRRRIGRANLGRDLQQQPAQAMLVRNLRDPRYVQIVCGSLENLPAAFAGLDRAEVAKAKLTRDHRDTPLDRLVRRIMARTPELSEAGKLPVPRPRADAHATAI